MSRRTTRQGRPSSMNAPHNATPQDGQGDRLGMNEPISRRDFVNGALLAGAGLLVNGHAPPTPSPADDWNGYSGIGDYRHSNGNTYEVMSTAHSMRDGVFERSIASAI